MKRISTTLSVAALLAAAAVIGFGCSAQESVGTDQEMDEAEAEDIGAAPQAASDSSEPEGCAGTWSYLPAGAQTWQQPDGSLGYQLPTGFVSYELDPVSGIMVAEGGGSITCTCSSGSGGCSPVSAGGQTGCFIGSGCTTCTKSGAAKVVDLNAGVRFAKSTDVGKLPHFTPDLLDVPQIAAAFHDFKATVASDAGLPGVDALEDDAANSKIIDAHNVAAAPGWALVPVNVFGRIAVMSVPKQYAQGMMLAVSAKHSCSCSAGSGCTAGSMLGAKFCNAGSCTKCTMSLSAAMASVSEMPACGVE